MTTVTTPPKSPEDMPWEWGMNDRAVRNCLVTLNHNRVVDLHWEVDVDASNRLGEPVGEWTVTIQHRAGRVIAKHERIANALWFATTLAAAR
jgi:hypothetical protein